MKINSAILILLLGGVATFAGERYQPIAKDEMARRTLDEEELEASIAEERASAKFYETYRSNVNDLIKPRACKIHDRVTFIINEKTDTKIEAKNDLKSESKTILNLQNWFKLGTNSKGDMQLKPYSMKSEDGELSSSGGDNDAQINFKNNSEHKAEGKTNRVGSFVTKLSGEVIEVLPNGHLVVEAKKSIHVNEETQEVVLVGTVNPDDLNDKSEIPGERVIDLKIALKGKGEVTDNIRQGWMSKIVTKFKPF